MMIAATMMCLGLMFGCFWFGEEYIKFLRRYAGGDVLKVGY